MDIRKQIEARIEAEKAKREAAGLLVEWSAIPDPRGGTRYFSAYASSEAVKQEWIAAGEAKGWVLK
jgi:hypothetical protein